MATLAKILTSLPRMMSSIIGPYFLGILSNVALLFTFAAVCPGVHSDQAIHPFPPKLFGKAKMGYQNFGRGLSTSRIPISQDAWTVIIIQEHETQHNPEVRRFRVGFAIRDAKVPNGIRVLDVPGFLHDLKAGHLLSVWNQKIVHVKNLTSEEAQEGKLVDIVPCDEVTVQNLVELFEMMV